mgnify:CR=1 FL=1
MIPRMTAFPRLRSAPRWARGAARRAGLAALLALAACSTDTLSVEDPDIIDPDDVQSADGHSVVLCAPESFEGVKQALLAAGFIPGRADVVMRPGNRLLLGFDRRDGELCARANWVMQNLVNA